VIAIENARLFEAEKQRTLAFAHVNHVITMGHLAASIAHEVNQPIAAIVTTCPCRGSGERQCDIGTLVPKKRLVLNASCRCLLGTLRGKKTCDINKWLNSERFRSV
jgi:hypothetical protein